MIKTQDRNYVSHEYFNQNWHPESFSEVHDLLSEAKLSFGASANIIDNIEAVSVPAKGLEILNTISNEVLRETTKDYFVNQQFRRDIFVKGPRRMTTGEVLQEMEKKAFILLGDPANPPRMVRTPAGEAELRPEIFDPVVASLIRAGRQPVSVRALIDQPECAALTPWRVWETLLILMGVGYVAPVGDSDTPEADRAASARLNQEICSRAKFSGSMQYLAAPVIGSAISLGRIEQLMLLAQSEGAEDVVGYVWDILSRQGERLLVEDKALETPEENIAHLKAMFEKFQEMQMPILTAVGAAAIAHQAVEI
jgi:hypothetical protein